MIGMVIFPAVSLRLRNGLPKCLWAKDLQHGGEGRRHAQDPPIPPRSIADYCHIHPWIFSTPWPPYVAFSPIPQHIPLLAIPNLRRVAKGLALFSSPLRVRCRRGALA
jgi:hypothetical protein